MTTKWEKVYVFISSTFNDMHGERDYLVKQVFPQLQEWCERRKLRLVDIDLRWGVTEQDALYNKNALKVCLDRIDECRPFFLCFLGQRRGWVPKKEEISSETFDLFPELRSFAGKTSITEMEILHALINPLHQGKPRDPGKPDEYYERVKHAFFYLRDPSYLDKLPSSPPLLRQTYTNEGVEDAGEWEIHEQELENWREVRIKKESNRPVHSYEAKWDSSAVTPELALPLQCPSAEPINIERWWQQWIKTGIVPSSSNIEDNPPEAEIAKNFNKQLCTGRLTDFRSDRFPLSQVIIKDLQEAIANRYPDHIEVVDQPDFQKEIDQQEQFLFVNSEGFIERGNDFAELDEYVENDSNKLFVLTAPGGMGKSMLLANWVDRYRTRIENKKEESIHFRFIGASDRSTTISSLLRFLLLEMKEITHKFDKDIPENPEELHKVWPELLDALSKSGKTIIVIDALNQLESGLSDLNWLPWKLPSNIKLIVSFKRGEQKAEELYQRFSEGGQVVLSEVQPFENPDDRRKLVRAYLSQYLKDIDKQHLETLIESEGANNPLYLKVVLSELRVFGAFASLEDKIRKDFGETPISAFQGVLTRLESDPAYSPIHPGQAVPLLFGLMAHARHGLSADELTSLFVQMLNMEDIREQREIAADTVNLFLRQVRPFLAHREGRYDFFFESFKNAAEECYVAKSTEDMSPRRLSSDWHRMLAVYFGSIPTWQEKTSLPKGVEFHDRIPTLRKVSELAYHQAWAGMGELVETLTNFSSMDAKLYALGIYPLIEDYDLVLVPVVGEKVKLSEKSLRLIQGALRLSAHIILNDKTQLSEQLIGRLIIHESQEIESLRNSIKKEKRTPWLRPLTSNLIQAGGILMSRLKGHTDGVNSVALASNGKRAISASRDKTLKLWDLESSKELRTLYGHLSSVYSVWVTPNEKQAISKSEDEMWRLWDLENRVELQAQLGIIEVSPDCEQAISVSRDNKLKLWDMKTGVELQTLHGHTDKVNSIAFMPDGKRAVSASRDKTLRLWDLESGKELRTLQGHANEVMWVYVRLNGIRAISKSSSELIIWDIETGKKLTNIDLSKFRASYLTESNFSDRFQPGSPIPELFVSHIPELSDPIFDLIRVTQKHVILALRKKLMVWDIESGQELPSLVGHADKINYVESVLDDHCAISASDDCTLKIWDLENGMELKTLDNKFYKVEKVWVVERRAISKSFKIDDYLTLWDLDKGNILHTLEGRLVGMTPDSKHAFIDSRGILKVWDLESGKELQTLKGHIGNVNAVVVTPDGTRAISASDDKTLNIWNLENNEQLKIFTGHIRNVNAVAVTPDGTRAISASDDNTLKVWDLKNASELRILMGYKLGVKDVTMMPDGQHAITGSDDGPIKIWNLDNGLEVQNFTNRSKRTMNIRSLTVTPDGHYVVSLSIEIQRIRRFFERLFRDDAPSKKSFILKIWDRYRGVVLKTMKLNEIGDMEVNVTPDGHRVIFFPKKEIIKIWNLKGWLKTQTLKGHNGKINSVAVTPNSCCVISASSDKTLKMWDLKSGKELQTFTGHTDEVYEVAVTPNGKCAISSSFDGTLRIWDLVNGVQLQTLLKGRFSSKVLISCNVHIHATASYISSY